MNALCVALSSVAVPARTCLPEQRLPPQGVALKLHIDSWPTSEVVTEVGAILLRERMGFNVTLTPPPTGTPTRDLYERVALGSVHLAFDLWPSGKRDQAARWASNNGTANTTWAIPYLESSCQIRTALLKGDGDRVAVSLQDVLSRLGGQALTRTRT